MVDKRIDELATISSVDGDELIPLLDNPTGTPIVRRVAVAVLLAGAPHPDLSTHDALGLATDAELASHAAAADPHTVYQKESEKAAANGYAGLGANSRVPVAQLGTGTPDGTKFLRDDQTYAVPAGGGGVTDHGALTGLANDDHPQYATDADLTTHAGAADPHTDYRLESENHSHATSGLQGGTVAHSATTGQGTDDHHAKSHVLATDAALGADHTISGGVAGYVLRALTATTAKFMQLLHSDLGGVTADQHHAQSHTNADHSAAGTPSTQAFGDAASSGAGTADAKDTHKHAMPANPVTGLAQTINFVIDGGGSVITTGVKGDLVIDFACTITKAVLLADQSGSIVVNVWKDTYANFPPVVGDKITASAPPTITTATKSSDATLTGWTTAIAAGDILRFNVDSVTTIQRATLALTVTRT